MSIVRLGMKYVNVLHILVIGAALVYIGYFQDKSFKPIYYVVGLLGLAIILFVPFPTLEFTNLRNILNIIHYILFIPGFIALAYFGLQNKLTKETYTGLGFLGAFIIIYHLYKLFTRLM